MSNFIDDCISGNALLDDVDDYVEKWHRSESSLPIYDFLGMSRGEYALWLADASVLPFIVIARRENLSVQNVLTSLNELPVAARASNPATVRKLLGWLKKKGFLE